MGSNPSKPSKKHQTTRIKKKSRFKAIQNLFTKNTTKNTTENVVNIHNFSVLESQNLSKFQYKIIFEISQALKTKFNIKLIKSLSIQRNFFSKSDNFVIETVRFYIVIYRKFHIFKIRKSDLKITRHTKIVKNNELFSTINGYYLPIQARLTEHKYFFNRAPSNEKSFQKTDNFNSLTLGFRQKFLFFKMMSTENIFEGNDQAN